MTTCKLSCRSAEDCDDSCHNETHEQPVGESAGCAAELRRAAKEIADAGHAGWGNTCTQAAAMLEADAPRPAMKPFTEGEIQTASGASDEYWASSKLFIIALWRQAEAAHGIK